MYADAQNYITEQHNKLGEWLHENLCLIYEQVIEGEGGCDRAIGPLEEHQGFIPVQFHKPEGPTILYRLEQIQNVLTIGNEAGDKDDMYASNDSKTNAHSASIVQSELETKFEDVQGKIDAVSLDVKGIDNKVDGLESKVESVENELRELKDIISKLVNALT